MIMGELKHYDYFSGLGKNFMAGLKFLADKDLDALENKKYILDGDNLYFEVSDITTKNSSEKLFEIHKKYADIHITLKGLEFYGFNKDLTNLAQSGEYNQIQDTLFYAGAGDKFNFNLPAGYFMIFMPNEPHKPGLCLENSGNVHKIVMKVKVYD